jgi:hypothetical protein
MHLTSPTGFKIRITDEHSFDMSLTVGLQNHPPGLSSCSLSIGRCPQGSPANLITEVGDLSNTTRSAPLAWIILMWHHHHSYGLIWNTWMLLEVWQYPETDKLLDETLS